MLKKFRFLTAGESHGKCLTAIIEGIPSGFVINPDFINKELKRRQGGYGRGGRMKIESDTVEITSGVRFGKTLGSPITLVIKIKILKIGKRFRVQILKISQKKKLSQSIVPDMRILQAVLNIIKLI